MTANNYIYPFAQPEVPPNILSTADYAASSVTTTTGYVADSIASSAYMSKAQRQTSAICAGVGQFIADNETGTTDVTDDLSPATIAAMIEDAAGNVALAAITTQPQFDNSTKAATTEFVQRALGNLANSQGYAVNTTLTNANIGGIVVPTAGSLGFALPLISGGLPNGAQITFNGNTFGCVISRQSPDTILAGSSGAVTTLSLEANDSAIFTVVDGQWALTGGELHQSVSSTFSGSLTPNGWASIGKLIVQWGQVTTGAGGDVSFSFPIPFPTAIFTLNGTAGPKFVDNTPTVKIVSSSTTTGSFEVRYGPNEAPAPGWVVQWFAIGH
jgi:hypothetical protein